MAGLLLKELKIRGLVKRTLIVTPASLSFQWQREIVAHIERTDERAVLIYHAHFLPHFIERAAAHPRLRHRRVLRRAPRPGGAVP